MDRELAQVIIRSLTTASSEVAMTAEMVRGQLPDLECKQYIHAVGSILGAIQLDLMAGILKDFPELDPERIG